jgi:hypothetical protein
VLRYGCHHSRTGSVVSGLCPAAMGILAFRDHVFGAYGLFGFLIAVLITGISMSVIGDDDEPPAHVQQLISGTVPTGGEEQG